jgi:hypothetical protein
MDAGMRTGAVVKLFERYGIRLDPNSGIDGPRIRQVVDTVSSCAAYGDAGPSTYIATVLPSSPWNWNWLAPWGFPLSPFGLGGFRARPRPSGALSDAVTPMTAWLVGAAVGGVATYVAVKKMNGKK